MPLSALALRKVCSKVSVGDAQTPSRGPAAPSEPGCTFVQRETVLVFLGFVLWKLLIILGIQAVNVRMTKRQIGVLGS